MAADADDYRTLLFNDHRPSETWLGNRAIYKDGWKAVTIHGNRMPWVTAGTFPFDKDVWELYNLKEDFSETNNLAEKNPEKLAELKKEWDEQAWKNNVYPLYDDLNARIAKQFARAFGDRENFTYYWPGVQRHCGGGFRTDQE